MPRTAHCKSPYVGYQPRSLNRFEEDICNAWRIDTQIVYIALDAWLTSAYATDKLDTAYATMRTCRENAHSPLDACDRIRELIGAKTAH